MDIKECRIDQKVMTETGRIGRITAIYGPVVVYVVFGGNACADCMRARDLTPVSDPCADCQKLEQTRLKAFREGKASCHDQIIGLISARDNWKADAERYCRNAAYCREELSKLQKEALAECDDAQTLTECYEILKHIPECTQHGTWCPEHMIDWIKSRKHEEEDRIAERDHALLAEVAKIYVTTRIDASQMLAGIRKVQQKLLSDDARIVCELLEGTGPMTSLQIAGRLNLLERCILESIIEARDAGKISLVDGEYSIARD